MHRNRSTKRLPRAAQTAALLIPIFTLACSAPKDAPSEAEAAPAEIAVADKRVAIAVLEPLGDSGVRGQVVFTEADDGVHVQADVSGLKPGKHGFHIHQWGDCSSADGKSAGGHFNPAGVDHAGPLSETAHAGDLGNIEASEEGHGSVEHHSKRISIGGENDILGRGVIIHAKEDDLTSQPTGAAGGRLACGVILEENAETQPVLADSEGTDTHEH